MSKAVSAPGWIAVLAVAVALSGCFDQGPKKAASSASVQPVTGAGPSAPTNQKPTISGTPPTSVLEGEAYDFRPSASDPDGDTLIFSVANKPSWAAFDASTGRLYGSPGAGDSGSYANIVISVSDGKAQASLSGYTLTVQQIALGSATLSWNPPTQNADGTPLTDLAGYKIYYGKSSAALDQTISINSVGITTYVVSNLSPATWYFAMTSYNAQGVESDRSSAVSKTIG
jgi:hypothetical protein